MADAFAWKTLDQLITLVEQELSQVPGTAVQLYSEDTIAAKIQQGFDFVFEDTWLQNYMVWETVTLDGTTGRPSSNFSSIKRVEDIRAIFRSSSSIYTDRPLPNVPEDINPNNLTGTTVRYWEGYNEASPAKLIQCWPITATDTLNVRGRAHPGFFADTDAIKVDYHLLVAYAAWAYITDDESAPDSAAKFLNQFETRLAQYKKRIARRPIILDPARATVPDQWYEALP